jgi:hypothetical protein
MLKNFAFMVCAMTMLAPSIMSQEMNQSKLKLILAKKAVVVEESQNSVQYKLEGILIYLVTDENANRMRLMALVIEQSKLKDKDMVTLMAANFDKALDAKYALYNNFLWSVFTHPLKELEPKQIVDAFYQVKTLVENYGTSYTSSNLVFSGN